MVEKNDGLWFGEEAVEGCDAVLKPKIPCNSLVIFGFTCDA
jgi:hypothetical protein